MNNKYLIVGLGNPGPDYESTRHNAGFEVVETLHPEGKQAFEDKRYGWVARMRLKNKELILLKPSTYINLSGNAVRYWMKEEKIDLSHLLIVVDDLSLPFGQIRLKERGSDAGHNGLKHIAATLGTEAYPRLKFGIGSNFPKGGQIEYVLAPFSDEEEPEVKAICTEAAEAIKTFCLAGAAAAMNQYNKRRP